MGEEGLEWACGKCEKRRVSDLHPYTLQVFRLRRLRLAGYPFRAGDLTPEAWEDLGRAEEVVEELRRREEGAVIAGALFGRK